jgi:hypothetical protein
MNARPYRGIFFYRDTILGVSRVSQRLKIQSLNGIFAVLGLPERFDEFNHAGNQRIMSAIS